MKKSILITLIGLLVTNLSIAASKDPVAVLFQVKGKVEYTKNGVRWKKVRRNKFLFEGYKVRSDESGSGIISNRITGKDSVLGPNTLVLVKKSGLEILKGGLADYEKTNTLVTGLMSRFTRSQRYTTVRRNSEPGNQQIEIARHIVLTDDYPYLVWENIDEAYSYQLWIGDDHYQIGPSEKSVVRVKINPFEGTKAIKIKAFKNDKEILELKPFQKNGSTDYHTAHWMSESENQDFQNSIRSIQSTYPDNMFMLGSFFEREKMWSAAMDQYKKYLEDNPDEIEMTPYLFRVYKVLKLKKIYNTELVAWTQAMKE